MKITNYSPANRNKMRAFFLLHFYGLVLLTCLSNSGLYGQSWVNTYPGAGRGSDIVEAANGDLLTIGDPIDNDDQEVVITRISQDGALVWQRSLPANSGISSTGTLSIVKTPDNHFVAAYQKTMEIDGEENVASMLRKIDDEGNTIWEVSHPSPDNTYNRIRSLVTCSDNGFLVAGNVVQRSYIMKLDENGALEWLKEYNDFVIHRAIEATNGDLLVGGTTYSSNSSDGFLARVDNTGTPIWQQTYGDIVTYDRIASVIETNDNGIALLRLNTDDLVELIKTNSNGDLLWRTDWGVDYAVFEGSSKLLFQREDGVFKVLSSGVYTAGELPTTTLDEDGEILNQCNFYFSDGYSCSAITSCANGGFAIVGGQWNSEISSAELTVAKTNSEGTILSGTITGTVFQDDNFSCTLETGEAGLSNWIVTAINTTNQSTYAATTDSAGTYQMPVFAGTYEVSATPLVPVWQPCPGQATQTVTITVENGVPITAEADFAMQSLYDCPVLSVDISTPFLRRCFDNTYYVNYCNLGTDVATDAYVEVVLDDYMTITSASIPYENPTDSTLLFPVGDLGIGECGQFTIGALIDCESTILGQTHCTTAHIYPDDYCLPLNDDWDMSSIIIEGFCDTDSVRFVIINEGDGDMTAPLDYIIVVDEVIMLQGDFQLGSGEMQEVVVPALGETYRMEADQAPGHPLTTQVSYTIDGCPEIGTAGYVNWFDLNDFLLFQDSDCQQNIGAYDPNDKHAFPKGYGHAHRIEPSTEIEYLIRFQNTGTDTAFQVVVRDELSEDLDITTLRMGVAGHPYRWEIVDNDILKVTFDNILLPDSTTNEQASHGFFKFSIFPKATLELGTLVENTAGIYFDFNAPIITNTVYHTIDTNFVRIELISFEQEPEGETPIHVFPNPLKTTAQFVMERQQSQVLQLVVYDASGRLVQQYKGRGNSLTLAANGLTSGTYFYRLFGDQKLLGTGRLIVVD
jgi:hypothetical protein